MRAKQLLRFLDAVEQPRLAKTVDQAVKEIVQPPAEPQLLLPRYTTEDLEGAILSTLLQHRQRAIRHFIDPQEPLTTRIKARPVHMTSILDEIPEWLDLPRRPRLELSDYRLISDILSTLRTVVPNVQTRAVYDRPKYLYDAYLKGGLPAAAIAFRRRYPDSALSLQELQPVVRHILEVPKRKPVKELKRTDIRLHNIDMQSVIDRLVAKFADEAPHIWESEQPDLSSFLLAHYAPLTGIDKQSILELLQVRPTLRSVPPLDRLLSLVQTPPSRIPSILAYVKSLPTKELTASGRLSAKGASPVAKTYADIRRSIASPELQQRLDAMIASKIDEAATHFLQAQELPSEFPDVVRRILRELPPDAPATMKTLKKQYPSEVARFGQAFSAILRKPDDDLRKITNEAFKQLPSVKGNPHIRAVWTRPVSPPPAQIDIRTYAGDPETLLVVGDPNVVYNALRRSPAGAKKYSSLTKAHVQYTGDVEPLPPVGWVRIERYYNQATQKPEWYIAEIQSDLLSAIAQRLNAIKGHQIAHEYYTKLDPSLRHADRVRKTREWMEANVATSENPSGIPDYLLRFRPWRIAARSPDTKELEALRDLQSKLKDWHVHAVAEVMDRARREGIERVHLATPEHAQALGLQGKTKLKTFYEDVPKRFKFSRGPASDIGVPLAGRLPDDVWTRVPGVIPPGMLLGEFLTEE